MSYRQGFTLMEMLIVLFIIGLCTALVIPSYLAPSGRSKAIVASNNLLAIYSAQQNYRNNTGSFVTSGIGNLAAINSTFSLNIQDDGSYAYACIYDVSGFLCTASAVNPTITFSLYNKPIQLIQSDNNPNPVCTTSAGSTGWCP